MLLVAFMRFLCYDEPPMIENSQKKLDLRTKKYILLLVLGWTLLMFISLSWNSQVTHENNIEKARLVARSFYELTIQFRRWGAWRR